MSFRFDIGALRAFAVITVFLYHFKVPFFDGGFAGVDIFFVISGYLMTNIILKGFQKNNFSYLKFIEKRIIRIIPPLLVIGLFILFVSSILFFGDEVSKNAGYVGKSITFLSNFFYLLTQNYFDADTQNNIFIHSWSLSVEWQFYMFYPLLLLIFRSWYLNKIQLFKVCFLSITSLSFALCILLTNSYNSFSFYMMPTRAWEMLLGGVAFLYADFIQQKLRRHSDIIVIISLVILVLSIFLFNESYVWPSAYSLIPTGATFLIIALNRQFSWFRNPVLQFFGNISYSLYLWHWPLYVIFKYFALTETIWVIVPFFLSLVLSTLTYFMVEKNKSMENLKVVTAWFFIVLALSVILFKFPNNEVIDKVKVFNSSYRNYFQYDQTKQFNSCNCFLTDHRNYKIYSKENCLKIDTTKRNIMLLGDSHAAQFSRSFRNIMNKDENLIELSAGFVFPFLNSKGSESSIKLMTYFYNDFLPQNYDKIDKIFISVHWLMKSSSKMNYSDDEIKKGILDLMRLFDSYKLNYSFIGQTEVYTAPYSRIIIGEMLSTEVSPEKYMNADAFEMNAFLKSFIPKNKYIDIYNMKIISKNNKKDNMPYMFDTNHLTEFGADQYTEYIKRNGYFK